MPEQQAGQKDLVPQLKTCSLWEAFDKAQVCYTVGPQLTNYYRYGEFKGCGDLINDFKFCWRLRGQDAQRRHDLITAREEARYDRKTRQRPSLEVWKLKETPGTS